MLEVVKSSRFDRWLKGLKDARAKARIEARILRLAVGNAGDVKPVGGGISEMRIDYGPGVPRLLLGTRKYLDRIALRWRQANANY